MRRLLYKVVLYLNGLFWLFLSLASDLKAVPHFRVYPKYVENDIRGMGQTRDTLRISNAEGDAELVWRMEIQIIGEPADSQWVSATVTEGRVDAGQQTISILRMNGRQLANGHYFANLYFTSNDPNRPEWTVPVAGHKDDFPRIAAEWQIPQQGDNTVIDMNRFLGELLWGNEYSFPIVIRNRGSAQLVVDSLVSQNALFRFNPTRFTVDAGAFRQVMVIFSADEIRVNSTTVSSISNVWDPAELNFRIVANVSPVFRFGSPVPDIVMDEDAPECLVADLDTVFISSYGETVYNISGGLGFTYRLARNHEFFIRPRLNWNGVSTFFLTASLGDTAVLRDTFWVTVRPVPDSPGVFDLLAPADEDTLWYDRGDSLFIWQSSIDPDGDIVKYELIIVSSSGDTTIWRNLRDTTFSTLSIFMDNRFTGCINWTVMASDSNLTRQAWSIFRLYLLEGRQGVCDKEEILGQHKIKLFPNPTNGIVCLNLNAKLCEVLKLELLTIDGKVINSYNKMVLSPGNQNIIYNLNSIPNGVYFLRVRSENIDKIFKVRMLK